MRVSLLSIDMQIVKPKDGETARQTQGQPVVSQFSPCDQALPMPFWRIHVGAQWHERRQSSEKEMGERHEEREGL